MKPEFTPGKPTFVPGGVTGLYVRYGGGISPRTNARVRALAHAVREGVWPGVTDVVPAYSSLYIEFDPLRLTHDELRGRLEGLGETLKGLPSPGAGQGPAGQGSPGRRLVVPVCYGGEFGPDLEPLADEKGLSAADVVRLHSGREYLVYCIGFVPGFPFMGTVPGRIAAARLPAPRPAVPAGSVGIAGAQTGIYPFTTPGGWRLIGRTPMRLFDPGADDPVLMRPGDRVRFKPLPPPAAWPEAPAVAATPAAATPAAGQGLFEVLDPGPLTTVQDLGRRGFQHLGFSVGGAADRTSLRLANLLAGNPPGAAGLEMTAKGPTVRFLAPAVVAVAGADLGPVLNGSPLPLWESRRVEAGDLLGFRGGRRGLRSYLAVAGGIDVPACLGSRATDLVARIGGVRGRPLRAGDVLPAGAPAADLDALAGWAVIPEARPALGGDRVTVRLVAGPDGGLDEQLLWSGYRVTAQSDRMGLRLEGPALPPPAGDLTSEPLPLGTVQLPPSGQPVVLLAGRQTIGGYAKIGVVLEPDVDLLAQAVPGQEVRFVGVSLSTARSLVNEHLAGFARRENWLYHQCPH